MNRILIAEDEERIALFIQRGLSANGYVTEVVADGASALRLARSGRFDLLLLDLGLPVQDGLDVLHLLREEGTSIPVVILTASSSVREVVRGLEDGADDYITKPFSFDELLARVRTRLQRENPPDLPVLRVGDAELDLRARTITVGGRTEELSAREFGLAEMFFRHPEHVLSREQLLSRCFDPGSNVVDVYVGYLRKKLGKERIVNIRGMGYRFEPGPRARRRRR